MEGPRDDALEGIPALAPLGRQRAAQLVQALRRSRRVTRRPGRSHSGVGRVATRGGKAATEVGFAEVGSGRRDLVHSRSFLSTNLLLLLSCMLNLILSSIESIEPSQTESPAPRWSDRVSRPLRCRAAWPWNCAAPLAGPSESRRVSPESGGKQ